MTTISSSTLIAALLAGVSVFMTYILIDRLMAEKRRKGSLRSRITSGESSADPTEEALSLQSDISPPVQLLANILAFTGTLGEERRKKLELRFARAGKMSPEAPILYVFFQRIVSIALVILALVIIISTDASGLNWWLHVGSALLLAAIGIFGPHLYVENLIARRKKILTRAFPDTLDLLLICVESGLALDAALNRVCSELRRSHPEMTQELNRTRIELALLNDRVKALMHLAERTDLLAFRALTASLVQSERLGTSLTDTLRVLSEEFRLERLSKAEEKAARLPVLLTIPLVLLLMPAFMLIVLGPAIISFMRQGSSLTGG